MTFELPKEKRIDETKEFKTFSEDIDYLTEFFSSFSDLICFNGRRISFLSQSELYMLNTDLIDSSTQTLKSIKLCCSIGSFSDANTLIRKLRDDLIQYLYMLNVISLRKPFVEESIKDLDINDPEKFVNSMLSIQYNNILTDDEQAVTAWFKNTVSDLKGSIRKKLEFENYMRVLKQNTNIKQILTEYGLEKYWETLRKRLNNYVHNNGKYFPIQNFISANDEYLGTHLKNINIRTSYISSFFLIVLLMIESSLISSTDYVDHLDCNMKPPDDSFYSIANFVQDFIDKKVSTIHPELKQYLKDNNVHGMKIE